MYWAVCFCLCRKSSITVNDILSALEDDDFNAADIYLTAPDDGAGSDEGSGGEDDVAPNNLRGKQLNATGVAVIHRKFTEKEVIRDINQTELDAEAGHPNDTAQVCDSIKNTMKDICSVCRVF